MIELQVLNKVLATGDASLITSNNLTQDYFTTLTEEFKFIKFHIDKYGRVPDALTFKSKFPKFEIIAVNESNDYLLNELTKDKTARDIAYYFGKIRDLTIQGKVDEALQLYSTSIEELNTNKISNAVDLITDTSRYDAYVERITTFDKYYVKTGFKELDDVIGGWDREEELAVIVARPNVGKSYILLKCVVAAAQQGLKVGLFSGEMSPRKVGYRMDTLLSHISNKGMIRGDESIQLDYKQYLDNLPKMISGSIKVLTPVEAGGPVSVSALRAFIEREDLDILFVDQHSLLEDDRHGKSAIERASNISRDLKNLQVMKRIPIISVSQQNRESTEKGVGTELISQSDRIGQDSSIVIFLERKDDILKLYLVKSRDSEKNVELSYYVDFNYGTFRFVPEEGATEEYSEDYQDRYNIEDGGNVF